MSKLKVIFLSNIFIASSLYLGVSYAQEEPGFAYAKYSSIGGYVGTVSGMGLSYRYHPAKPVLYQVTFGATYVDYLTFAVGFEAQYELSESESHRFYVLGGAGIYRYESDETKPSMNLHLGIGFGGEIALGSSLVHSLSLGVNFMPIAFYLKERGKAELLPGGALYLFYNW